MGAQKGEGAGEGRGQKRIPLSLFSPPPVPLLLTPATQSNTYSDENIGVQKGERAVEGRGEKRIPLSFFSPPSDACHAV